MTPRRLWSIAISALLGAGATAFAYASIRPSNDRSWIREQAVLPAARFVGSVVHVRGIRNFAYTARSEFTPAYYDRTFDLEKLTSVAFVLVPFSKRWRGPAHSFVTFGFADSQFVAISIEARREPGETYGTLAGLFKRFELMYVVGDERDLVGQRAAFGDEDVYLYPIRAPRDGIRQVFIEMLERANGLRDHPEFYNTLTNNCTSNLVQHVNRVTPGRVPGGLKTILPGYSDEVALRLGLIDSRLALGAARARFRINDQARRYINDSAFSIRLRDQVAR